MPTKKKKRPAIKKKATKKVKVKTKKTAKKTARSVKKSKAIAKKVTKKLLKKVMALGRVTHYYDNIGVAIIEVASPLKLGDTVVIRRGEQELTQSVTSLQIDHQPVTSAKKKDVVGMKVTQKVPQGAMVLPG